VSGVGAGGVSAWVRRCGMVRFPVEVEMPLVGLAGDRKGLGT
jgi:hypothetical protein